MAYDNLPLETADGRRCEVEFVSNVYLAGDTKVIQCNIRDITERVKAEEGRARLAAAVEQSAEKMESVGRLAGGVAHDFNNLLTAVMGYAEMIRDRVGSEQPIRGWIDEIMSGARRSADITRQLLAFARKQIIAPRVLDLNEAVDGMLKLLQRLTGEDIGIVWRPAPNLWHVKLDPSQFDQILANLCVNARDAIAGIGRITLETSNVESAERVADAGKAGVATAPRGRGETVLLVEDEKPLRVMCGLFLTAMGYDPVVAESPVHALEIARHPAKPIHVLLTDVVMPGMDGGQLAQRVCGIVPGVKVLFMSGYPADVVAGRGMLGQDAAFIAKPFARNELALKLREVLDNA